MDVPRGVPGGAPRGVPGGLAKGRPWNVPGTCQVAMLSVSVLMYRAEIGAVLRRAEPRCAMPRLCSIAASAGGGRGGGGANDTRGRASVR
eukprot:8946563-Pyramimonas_sp.AAC.1